MRHGYTNRTDRSGAVVRKVYAGPDADLRRAAELRALHRLSGRVPIPQVAEVGPGYVTTTYVDGEHGQDLIESGNARLVLAECGRILRQLHGIDPRTLDPTASNDCVVQHGDFGANNLLFDVGAGRVTAILDLEFSNVGDAITDIAWCEWIIRMHHPDAVADLPAFFEAYGATPPWRLRQQVMLRRCLWLEDFTNRWDPEGPGVSLWQQRARTVEGWTE